MALLQPVTAGKRHVANIGNAQVEYRRAFENMIVRTDALNGAQRSRAETRASAIGNAKVHRHANHGDLEIAEIRIAGIDGHMGRGQEGRHARIWRKARTAF